jgi:mRNA-degrading endonuclease RelE of RelBE toxin-antitoxin system
MWAVKLSDAAVQSFQTLSPDDQRVVLQAIGRLALGPNPPGLPQPQRLRNRPDLIVLRAGARYRVAYTLSEPEQTITVVDVVAHDHAPGRREAQPTA